MEAAAYALDVDRSTLSLYAQGKRDLPAHRLPAFTAEYGPEALEAINRACGFTLNPNSGLLDLINQLREAYTLFTATVDGIFASAGVVYGER
jgi:hypothetical protein